MTAKAAARLRNGLRTPSPARSQNQDLAESPATPSAGALTGNAAAASQPLGAQQQPLRPRTPVSASVEGERGELGSQRPLAAAGPVGASCAAAVGSQGIAAWRDVLVDGNSSAAAEAPAARCSSSSSHGARSAGWASKPGNSAQHQQQVLLSGPPGTVEVEALKRAWQPALDEGELHLTPGALGSSGVAAPTPEVINSIKADMMGDANTLTAEAIGLQNSEQVAAWKASLATLQQNLPGLVLVGEPDFVPTEAKARGGLMQPRMSATIIIRLPAAAQQPGAAPEQFLPSNHSRFAQSQPMEAAFMKVQIKSSDHQQPPQPV